MLQIGLADIPGRASVPCAALARCTRTLRPQNYFYPDTPKNYQITQYDHPIAEHGELVLPSGKKVRCRVFLVQWRQISGTQGAYVAYSFGSVHFASLMGATGAAPAAVAPRWGAATTNAWAYGRARAFAERSCPRGLP